MFAACDRLCSCRSFHLNLTSNWFCNVLQDGSWLTVKKKGPSLACNVWISAGIVISTWKKHSGFVMFIYFSASRSTQGPRRKSPVRVTRVSLARVKTAKARMEKVMAKERKVKEKERKTGVTGSSLGILFIKVLQKFRISANATAEKFRCHRPKDDVFHDLTKELNSVFLPIPFYWETCDSCAVGAISHQKGPMFATIL